MIPINQKEPSNLPVFARVSQDLETQKKGQTTSNEDGKTPISFLDEMGKSNLLTDTVFEENTQSTSSARLSTDKGWPLWGHLQGDAEEPAQSIEAPPEDNSAKLETGLKTDAPAVSMNGNLKDQQTTIETKSTESPDESTVLNAPIEAESLIERVDRDLEGLGGQNQTEPTSVLAQAEEPEQPSLPAYVISAALTSPYVVKTSADIAQVSTLNTRSSGVGKDLAQAKEGLEDAKLGGLHPESPEQSAKVEYVPASLTSKSKSLNPTMPLDNSDKLLRNASPIDLGTQIGAPDQSQLAMKVMNTQAQIPLAPDVAAIGVIPDTTSEVGQDDIDLARAFDLTGPKERNPLQAVTPQAGSQLNGVVARQVFGQISAGLSQLGDGGIEIRLNPVELGRITIQLIEGVSGQSANVLVEKPEVLDLLRRNENLLQNEFKDAGFASMSFSFDQQQDPEHEQDVEFSNDASDYGADSQTQTSASPLARLSADLDIRL